VGCNTSDTHPLCVFLPAVYNEARPSRTWTGGVAGRTKFVQCVCVCVCARIFNVKRSYHTDDTGRPHLQLIVLLSAKEDVVTNP